MAAGENSPRRTMLHGGRVGAASDRQTAVTRSANAAFTRQIQAAVWTLKRIGGDRLSSDWPLDNRANAGENRMPRAGRMIHSPDDARITEAISRSRILMSSVVTCPKCRKAVSMPAEAELDAWARCPLCLAKFQLHTIPDKAPP